MRRFLCFMVELAEELVRIQVRHEQRERLKKVARYYRNLRLHGCGCCDGPPPL